MEQVQDGDQALIARVRQLGSEITEILQRRQAELAERDAEIATRQTERAALVRQLHEQGMSWQQLGDALGVSRARARQYMTGQPSNAERRRRRASRPTAT